MQQARKGSGGSAVVSPTPGEADTETSEFVVKMEPHNNGPLFTEMHVMYR